MLPSLSLTLPVASLLTWAVQLVAPPIAHVCVFKLASILPSLPERLPFIVPSLPELANQLQAQLALSLLRQLQQGDGQCVTQRFS